MKYTGLGSKKKNVRGKVENKLKNKEEGQIERNGGTRWTKEAGKTKNKTSDLKKYLINQITARRWWLVQKKEIRHPTRNAP